MGTLNEHPERKLWDKKVGILNEHPERKLWDKKVETLNEHPERKLWYKQDINEAILNDAPSETFTFTT